MKLLNLRLKDLAIIIKDHLIISDIHIGYEEALNKQGILVPRFQLEDILERLKTILEKEKIKTIVINGDIKHEFGTISDQEWRDTLRVIDFFKNYEIILVKGNHDTILGPIAVKKHIKFVDSLVIDDFLITHGDKIKDVPNGIKTIIIGHEHPAITLREGAKEEKYKCFLKGKWKKYNLIVMPSMFQVTEGNDVLKEKLLSPYLTDISKFEVYVVADKIYDFGVLKKLKKL